MYWQLKQDLLLLDSSLKIIKKKAEFKKMTTNNLLRYMFLNRPAKSPEVWRQGCNYLYILVVKSKK